MNARNVVTQGFYDFPHLLKLSNKEFASKKKYNERIHDDAAVSRYRKNLNKLNMRTKRAPAVYKPETFEEWSKAAKQALEDFRNKKISEEEFYKIIEVPPIKGS